MPYIPTEKVESSNIEAIGYHRQSQTLRVIFQGNRAYDYPMVPEPEFKRLMEAESKGKFFNTRIKPMYGHATVRADQLQPPKEPCCNHPGKACNDDDCGTCDPGCCPQEKGHLGQALSHGLDRGRKVIEDARAVARGVPPALLRTPEGEVDFIAGIPVLDVVDASDEKGCTHQRKEATEDGTIVGCADCGADLSPDDDDGEVAHLDTCPDPCSLDHAASFVEGADLDDGVCRCCAVPIKIAPEDAVELCMACFHSKGGDTDKPCAINHPDNDCPHGADGRNCETGCNCTCHYKPIGKHTHPQLESEPKD